MKLDNIIYDKDSLAAAIAEQWSADSELFASIYPSDTATALINGMAAYGSLLTYTIVSCLANCYTTTAFSEAAIYQLADTLGNTLHGNVSSQVLVNMTKTNFKGINTIIPAYSTFTINGKSFFNPHAIIIPAITDTVTDIVLVQGEIIEVNKTTSGVENEKFYFSSDFKASPNYINVYVNGEEWNVVESFLGYDKSYVLDVSDMDSVLLKTDPDGRAYVKVGDGQLATLPMTGSILQIKYCSNEGKEGNISETGIYGELTSPLMFVDNAGNQGNLEVEIITTTTAYGGFSKQSIDTLKYTSPWVFASGNRAVRRQDYKAMLQNKCGYLTSNVWGEYEEAEKAGTYDSLMMNMVYYTGLKSFETYPYFNVDPITNQMHYKGSLYSNSGFWGSYAFRILNNKGSDDQVIIQDTGAQGLLFINQDNQDPRDSILPDWIASLGLAYSNNVVDIISQGKNYKVNDELYVWVQNSENVNTGIIVRVIEVGLQGQVLAVELLTRTSETNYNIDIDTSVFSTTYYQGVEKKGTGFVVRVSQTQYTTSDLITTNDTEDSTEVQEDPIENAMSNTTSDVYYRSLKSPTLQNPVQIRINFPNEARGIAGIKFQAVAPNVGIGEKSPFIGTIAMFATNADPVPSYSNVRNSNEWVRIIDRKTLTSPWGNTNQNWTDWIATNCFSGELDSNGKPIFTQYKHYVIEFYSTQDLGIEKPSIYFDKMKVLYDEDASEILYNNNGIIMMNFPTAGSPGPGTESGYLTNNLLGSTTFPMYNYTITLDGITKANGYASGDKLAYVFIDGLNELDFIVDVANIDNSSYLVSLNGSTTLVDNAYIAMTSPVSLDLTKVYTHTLNPSTNIIPSGNGGYGYKANDIIHVLDENGDETKLSLRVSSVDTLGSVLSVVWLEDTLVGKSVSGTMNTIGGDGTGLQLVVVSSQDTQGSGATIQISSNYNMSIQASFAGNRIDSSDVNYYDEPIIKQYNHFTTYLEFKQPEIIQQEIVAQIVVDKDAPVTSGVVIQNVKNNIMKLFDITPDYIGKGLKLSDIYKAITDTQYVKWCKVLNPIDNVNVSINSVLISSYITVEEVSNRYD